MGLIGKYTTTVVILLWASGVALAAPTDLQKCQRAKLKAQGTLLLCLKKNRADLLLAKPDYAAKCREKFQAALAKDESKLTDGATLCRFVDNGDGTVSDLNTGLMWELKDLNGGLHTDFFTFSATGALPNGSAFSVFIPGLNDCVSADGVTTTTGFAGYCDWRVPSVTELSALLVPGCSGTGACIDPIFGVTPNTFTYTSTLLAANPAYHWIVEFFPPGYPSPVQTLTGSYDAVRGVRGGLEP
jgi:Protein of unknown function (DUF1566)